MPDVRKVALDRMVAAGLTTLDQFFKAKPGDIADAAGIARELAERIVARFQRYKRELGTAPPTPRRHAEKRQLEALTKKLEDQNAAYDAAAKHWSHGEDKRRIRQERASTLLEISLLLARQGEVDSGGRARTVALPEKSRNPEALFDGAKRMKTERKSKGFE
ncbi:MAG: hypothetical protein QM756_32855 [Polyangiaceae bacterium]